MSESEMPPDDLESLGHILMTAMEHKEEACRNGPEDTPPVVAYFPRGISSTCVAIAHIIPVGEEPPDYMEGDELLAQLIPMVMLELRKEFGSPRMVALITEGYCTVSKDGDRGQYRGMPAKACFLAGDPAARECMMIIGVRIGGPVDGEHNGQLGHMAALMPFHFEGGGIEWEEQLDPPISRSNTVLKALLSAFIIDTN